ncbi:MAG: hypothetical protein AAF725_27650, partial [Acidobacteriota bacterium]
EQLEAAGFDLLETREFLLSPVGAAAGSKLGTVLRPPRVDKVLSALRLGKVLGATRLLVARRRPG